MTIHDTAIVGDGAKIPASADIGPYCQIGPHVELGENVVLRSHVVVDGHTVIGEGTEVFPFATIGLDPQHLKYGGEPSRVVVGKNCNIREHVTIHRGTEGGRMLTDVGDRCTLMVSVHVAHDCSIGNDVIMANNSTLGGHCTIGDRVTLGGFAAIHQFTRVGDLAIIGGMAAVARSVIPYAAAIGDRAELAGINIIGLKRAGYSKDDIHTLRKAYRMLFSSRGVIEERANLVEAAFTGEALVANLVEFVRGETTKRSICLPRRSPAGHDGD